VCATYFATTIIIIIIIIISKMDKGTKDKLARSPGENGGI
jgi:hypothetical protein